MALLQRLLAALLASAILLLVQHQLRRRRQPVLPLRLVGAALLSWTLLPLLEALPLGLSYRPWVGLVDDLLLALASLRLVLWLLLEIPAGIGVLRNPPELLLQLLMLSGGALITVIVVRESARFDLVGLVATSAVLTAVVGLAAQETLKDLFAGLELQLGDDFDVGDWLDLRNGTEGVVESITWRDTILRDLDDNRLIIPNSKITEEVLINRSASGVASNRFDVGLDYSFPPARARQLLEGVLRQHPLVLSTPAPRVRLKAFAESAINYEVQVWQQEMNVRAALELRSDLQEQIWYALQRAGQSIPFPVRALQPRQRHTSTERDGAAQSGHDLVQGGVFAVMTPEQRHQLLKAGVVVHFGPGEAIVQEGDPGDCMFHLLDGEVDVLKAVDGNAVISVRRLGPGEHFGEMTLLLDEPRSATVRALKECRLLQLNRAALAPVLEEHPELLQVLAEEVSERQKELAQVSQIRSEQGDSSLLNTMRRLFQAVTGNSWGDA